MNVRINVFLVPEDVKYIGLVSQEAHILGEDNVNYVTDIKAASISFLS